PTPGREGGRSSELGLREQLPHGEEKPHECSKCGKSFGKRFQLIGHMRIHGGERP
ncbi:ZFP1 protein, partial [Mohoua ochrocephala]|nr:ZFP1 protein [Mohoua ochrocephala]